jgi:putative ABC transport system permease protein
VTLWLATVRLALLALLRQRLRSALTSLGILIGIAAVVVVVSLGQGARQQVGAQMQSLGTNVIYVFGRSSPKSGARVATKLPRGLTVEDADAIRREATAISQVTVYSSVTVQVQSDYGTDRVDVVGADEHYVPVRGYSLKGGRNLSDADLLGKGKVCLLGTSAAANLFGNRDPLGEILRVGKHAYQVVGLLEAKGRSPFGMDQDNRLVMPVGSWFARVSPSFDRRVQIIMASAREPTVVTQAERQITEIMRQRHHLLPDDENDFMVRSQQQFQETQEGISGVLTTLLLSVAGIALFVGGVGVMNIMLVSVNERRREIGIRIAIGARAADIRLQFLLEAVMLTLVGGVCGLGLAASIVLTLQSSFGDVLKLDWSAVWIALGTSAALGVLFGFLPAHRAAQLNPIDALRHE